MLRPGILLALSPTGTFVDALLRTDFAVRRHPSYAGAWPLPRPDFHRLEDACLWARSKGKEPRRYEALPTSLAIFKVGQTTTLTLRIQTVQKTRERNGFTHVVYSANPGYRTLQT